MKRSDGREVLLHLALPLPALLAADLMQAVETVATKHGYTEVSVLSDGSNGIIATPRSWAAAAIEDDEPHRCEGCGKVGRISRHEPGCPVCAAAVAAS